MGDMLVKLYKLPAFGPVAAEMERIGVTIRTAIAPEKHVVVGWVRATFGEAWASETEAAFSRQPVGCVVAIEAGQVVGFACVEATTRNYFGPLGVAESARRRGIGAALTLAALHVQKAMGYAYAIIGGAGPTEFYHRTAGAVPIEDSTPGFYEGMLWQPAASPQAEDSSGKEGQGTTKSTKHTKNSKR